MQHTRLCFVLICLLSMSLSLWALPTAGAPIPNPDAIAKGQFNPIPPSPVNTALSRDLISSTPVYTETFEPIPTNWSISSGWNMGQNPASSYVPNTAPNSIWTDNPYIPSANYQIYSPWITLPALGREQSRLILNFWDRLDLESGYDYAYLYIGTQGGNWTVIYQQTGSADWSQQEVNISQWAGQSVQFCAQITSDTSNQGSGWQIDDFKIANNVYSAAQELSLLSINSQNFPFIYSTLSVGMDLPQGQVLSASNFQVYENEVLQTNFFDVIPPSEGSGSRLVDIVFAMDNSGSMGSYINSVSTNVSNFIDGLSTAGVDVALGLCRYGSGSNSGWPIIEDNGVLTSNLNYFRDSVWSRNDTSGGYEPGYNAITQSIANFSWRPGAQKVLIEITDETPNQGGSTQQQALTASMDNGAIVFALTTQNLYGTFTPITEATNGNVFDIYSNFDAILTNISDIIVSNYILSYRSSSPNLDGVERYVHYVLNYEGTTLQTNGSYMPGAVPQISRTLETVTLDRVPQLDNQPITITTTITDSYSPFTQAATIYYKGIGQQGYTALAMTNLGNDVWQAVIPSGSVQDPGIGYYFSATDGQLTSTLPSTDPIQNPFTIAVLPNQPPVVLHTPIMQCLPNVPINVVVTATDDTYSLASVQLFYRRYGQLSYTSTEMQSLGDNQFSASIPSTVVSTFGTEYFIRATDNFGLTNSVGTADVPNYAVAIIDGTLLPGGILTDLSWDADGSPYYISSDVIVAPEDVLNIAPGTRIVFYPNTGLSITGGVVASNTVFAAVDSMMGWNGISITSDSDNIHFTDCTIRDAVVGFDLENSNGFFTNLTITKTNYYTYECGFFADGFSNPHLENIIINNYTQGIVLKNMGTRISSTPVLTNIRVRNTGSSIRPVSTGLEVTGGVELVLTDAVIEEFDNGILWTGNQSIPLRTTPVITNVRVRNTGSSIRTAGTGIKLTDLDAVNVVGDSIEGYPTGLHIETSNTGTRRVSNPVITNIRVRNTGSSLRDPSTGIKLTGSVLAMITDGILEDYDKGVLYQYSGAPTRTTPVITNVRVRNTSSSLRELPRGIQIDNLASVELHSNIVYPNVTNTRIDAINGFGIELNGVGSALLQKNTIWGYQTGFNASNTGQANFSQNVIWADGGSELQNPVQSNNSSLAINNNLISYANGLYPGNGNIDVNPLFGNAREGDFYLKIRSPIKNSNIGALGFDFDHFARLYPHTMHSGWNLMGVPYTTAPTASTPVAVFADDLNPFYVSPYYTSIVQYNSIAAPDTLGHFSLSQTGSYSTPNLIRPTMGYWVNSVNPGTVVDVYGLMDDGNWKLDLQGQAGPINGWYMLANPYDQPIQFGNGIAFQGSISPGIYVYNSTSNNYDLVIPELGGSIQPWSGFFVKANAATDKVLFTYPTGARLTPDVVNAPDVSVNPGSTVSDKDSWEIILNACNDDTEDTIALGAFSDAQAAFDRNDVPELPSAPFGRKPGIDLTIPNNNWEESPGNYARDIKALQAGRWDWNIVLNLENLVTEGRLNDSFIINLKELRNIPQSYDVILTDPVTGTTVDPRIHSLTFSVNYDNLGLSASTQNYIRPLQLSVINPGFTAPTPLVNVISTSNYPNPFNPSTIISYKTTVPSPVKLEVYNLKGQKVKTLVNAFKSAGTHSIEWNGTDDNGKEVTSGMYFYRLSTDKQSINRKILMLK